MTQGATPETTPARPKARIARYFWAVAITAAALGVRMLLDPILRFRIPYATFYIAAAISAVVGGWGPGAVSAILGGVAALYFILPPRYHPFKITARTLNSGLSCT
jgi:K+-sensing histidine kinase KdpD